MRPIILRSLSKTARRRMSEEVVCTFTLDAEENASESYPVLYREGLGLTGIGVIYCVSHDSCP